MDLDELPATLVEVEMFRLISVKYNKPGMSCPWVSLSKSYMLKNNLNALSHNEMPLDFF